MLKKLVVYFLIMVLMVPVGLLAQAKSQPKRDSHFVTKLGDELPDKNFFFREFDLKGIRQIKDLTKTDSDVVIRTAPMSLKGFLTGWLQPGQRAYIIPEGQRPVVAMIDAYGGASRIILNSGEAVIVDDRDPNATEKQILAVVRCGNKVLEGKLRITPPEVIEKVVEKEVRVEVEKIVQVPGMRGEKGDRGEVGPPGPQGPPGVDAKKHGHKKLWLILAGIGAAAVVGILLPRNKSKCCEQPEPQKPNVEGNGNQL